MIDPTKQPVHYAWGKFFRRFGPYVYTRFWQMDGHEPTPPHSHEFMEIILVAGGSVSHQTIHGTAVLKAGDGLLLRPGSWHAIGRANNLIAFNLCFIESAIRSYIPVLADSPILSNLLLAAPMADENKGVLKLQFNDNEMAELEPRLKSLDRMEHAKDSDVNAIEKIGLFVSCLGLIAKVVHSARPGEDKSICPITRHAIELIEGDTAHPWTLQTVADKINVDKSYLARLFKKGTGMTVGDFISRKRVEVAATFLINTDKSISEIAYITGWESPNYFARRFRKFYGMSASQYREIAWQ